jgi:hypothetical protein
MDAPLITSQSKGQRFKDLHPCTWAAHACTCDAVTCAALALWAHGGLAQSSACMLRRTMAQPYGAWSRKSLHCRTPDADQIRAAGPRLSGCHHRPANAACLCTPNNNRSGLGTDALITSLTAGRQ